MTRVVHVVLGLVVAVIGAVVLFQSVTGLSFTGANDEPGPGFFPSLLAGLLIVLGVSLSLGWLIAPRARVANLEELSFSRPALLRAGGVWLSLTIGVALLTTIGFLASSILIVALLVLGMEQLRGIRTVAAMLALPIGIYVVFSVLLEVRLPAGVFGS
jgi:hypothetical protein